MIAEREGIRISERNGRISLEECPGIANDRSTVNTIDSWQEE